MNIKKPEFLDNLIEDDLFLAINENSWKIAATIFFRRLKNNKIPDPNQKINNITLLSAAVLHYPYGENAIYADWVINQLMEINPEYDFYSGENPLAHTFFDKHYLPLNKGWAKNIEKRIFSSKENFDKILDIKFFLQPIYLNPNDEVQAQKEFGIVPFLVEKNNLNYLNQLKNLGFNFLEKDKENRNLLCFCNHIDTFNFLKNYSLSFDDKDNLGYTSTAYLLNNKRSVEFKKYVASTQNKKPNNAEGSKKILQEAQFDALKSILSTPSSTRNNQINVVKSSEFMAMRKAYFGKNIDYQNKNNDTILTMAIIKKQWNIVNKIIDLHPNWFLENNDKISPFITYLMHPFDIYSHKKSYTIGQKFKDKIQASFIEQYLADRENIEHNLLQFIEDDQKSSYLKPIFEGMLVCIENHPNFKSWYPMQVEKILNFILKINDQIIEKTTLELQVKNKKLLQIYLYLNSFINSAHYLKNELFMNNQFNEKIIKAYLKLYNLNDENKFINGFQSPNKETFNKIFEHYFVQNSDFDINGYNEFFWQVSTQLTADNLSFIEKITLNKNIDSTFKQKKVKIL